MTAALYDGIVAHARHRPARHALRYRIFMVLVELDGLEQAGRGGWFGVDRPGLISFRQRDHGTGSPDGLRGWVTQEAAKAGIAACGRIAVLCMPRVLGLAFNPLTVFFIHDQAGALVALLYEVNNTFGGRHAYVLRAAPGTPVVRHDCAKDFYVSPFMDMNLHDHFSVVPPGDRVVVAIGVHDGDGKLLDASFAATRRALRPGSILRAVLRMPLLGVSVPAAIHWEALRIWLKGVKLRPMPATARAGLVP